MANPFGSDTAKGPAATVVAASAQPVKSASFLPFLNTRPVTDMKPTNHLVVVANKGCKTVAAVAVDTPDGVGGDGEPVIATPGLPRPEGRTVIVTFDNQTGQSLVNRYGDLLGGLGIEILPIMDANGDYPGWDAAKVSSGPAVHEAFRQVLHHLREQGDVSLFVVDRYDIYIEDVAKYYTYSKSGKSLDGKMEPSDWIPRKNAILDVNHLIQTVPMDGGWSVVTGERDRNDGEETTVIRKEPGKPMVVTREVVPSRWLQKVIKWWPNIVQVEKYQEVKSGRYGRRAWVEEGRHPIFRAGTRIDIQGRHVGAFQDASAGAGIEEVAAVAVEA